MNFEIAVSSDSSRAMIETIADAIGNKADFEEVLGIAFRQKGMSASRAARVVDLYLEKNPELGEKYADTLAKEIIKLHDSRTKRSLCRVLTRHLPQNEQVLSEFIEFAFSQLYSASEPVALKVYAMQCLYETTRQYPELAFELSQAIEQEIPRNTYSFKVRGLQILKKLSKRSLI